MFSDKKISEFQALYRKRFGKEIGQKEALEKGMKLVRLLQVTNKPLTESEFRSLGASCAKSK
jgi:hypothetical protein